MQIQFSFNEYLINVNATCFALRNGAGYSFHLESSDKYFIETFDYGVCHIGAINPIEDWKHETNNHPRPKKFSELKWEFYKSLTTEIRKNFLAMNIISV